MKKSNTFIKFGPVVCAVGTDYVIMVPVKKRCIMSVKINDRIFFNTVNGIKLTSCRIQRFVVPACLLDEAGKYTVTAQGIQCGDKTTESESITYNFKPVSDKKSINIYHISDTHGLFKEPVKAADKFRGDIDLLILNGDISSSSNKFSDILLNYKIAFAVTKGEFPCLIIRGNHDLRGEQSQFLDRLLPTADGKPYYLTSLKNLDILVLDCGEDKEDSHREYDNIAAFHEMRLRETAFLKDCLASYDATDSECKRLIISHIPFNYVNNGLCKGERPFNIENEIYNEWTCAVNEFYKPDLYIVGHMHDTVIWEPDNINNHRGLNCHTVIASEPFKEPCARKMHSCFIELKKTSAKIVFNDSDGIILSETEIEY